METPSNRGQDFKVPGQEKKTTPEPLRKGEIEVEGRKYPWELVVSRGKSVTHGEHYNVISGEPDLSPSVIAALAAQTIIIANELAEQVAEEDEEPSYRVATNRGRRASTVTEGFHAHIIIPKKGDRLPRLVANVQEVVESVEDSGVRQELDKKLLQQK